MQSLLLVYSCFFESGIAWIHGKDMCIGGESFNLFTGHRIISDVTREITSERKTCIFYIHYVVCGCCYVSYFLVIHVGSIYIYIFYFFKVKVLCC